MKQFILLIKILWNKNGKKYYFTLTVPIIIFLFLPDQLLLNSGSLFNKLNQKFNSDLTCNRQDINCSNNGYTFALAVAAELNNVYQNCRTHAACNLQICCSDQTSLLRLDQNYSGVNPWYYCENKTDCTPVSCAQGGGTIHNNVTQSIQDQMISGVLTFINLYVTKPVCDDVTARIKDLSFFVEPFGSTPCDNSTGCADYRISVTITWEFCGNCSGEG